MENINGTYSNFNQKVIGVTDLVAPSKSRRIKQNSQEWFDGEVAEKKLSVENYLINSKNKNFILTNRYINGVDMKCKI